MHHASLRTPRATSLGVAALLLAVAPAARADDDHDLEDARYRAPVQAQVRPGHDGDLDRDDERCSSLGAQPRGHEVEDCRVLLTFATVGDSREEAGAAYLSPQDAIWLQNTRVWSRMMRELQHLDPRLVFFNGDMIMGYRDSAVAANHEQTAREYAFWRGMVTQLQETGTYVVPVPGNHETQDKKAGKISKLANEIQWRDNMADLVIDSARFEAAVGAPPTQLLGSWDLRD